jgi:2-polyprenyl-3-methyl-5-hydroxy-6-metoxy-1,4-benzoquinol methylase
MHCHICEQKIESFIDKKTDISYYHCESCEYIFKSSECHQDFERQKERYNLHTNDEEDLGYIAYFQRFLDFVLPKIDNSKHKSIKALDFGCGASSILSTMLQKEDISCDYYDPIYHPILDESKKYNLIVTTEVFEHLHQPKEVFESLVNRLEEGGYLFIGHSETIERGKTKFKFVQPSIYRKEC